MCMLIHNKTLDYHDWYFMMRIQLKQGEQITIKTIRT